MLVFFMLVFFMLVFFMLVFFMLVFFMLVFFMLVFFMLVFFMLVFFGGKLQKKKKKKKRTVSYCSFNLKNGSPSSYFSFDIKFVLNGLKWILLLTVCKYVPQFFYKTITIILRYSLVVMKQSFTLTEEIQQQLRQQHDANKQQLRQQHDANKQQLRQQHDASKQQLRQQHDANKQQLRQQHDTNYILFLCLFFV